jgi:electron transport complex protein RnfE
VLVSSCKGFIPKEVRISSYILVIATFVTLADMMLQAYAPVQHKELGAFIALIVVNCMILGRQEAFSARHTVFRSFLDAVGTGVGFTIALLMMGGFREIFGTGTFFDIPLFGPNFEPWVVFVLPAGGFLTLGFILLAMGYYEQRKAEKAA